MKKKEKLKPLDYLVRKFGLSARKIGEYFSAKTVANSAVSGKYQTPKRILPGMYVYADGLIYPEIIEGRQVKAVVGYVEWETVYAICLKEKRNLPWSSDHLAVEVSRNMTSGQIATTMRLDIVYPYSLVFITNGQKATAKILAVAKQKRKNAEAARWCHNYAEDGIRKGEAFLPSLDELEKLYENKKVINKSLKALNAGEFDGWYWSSTEYTNTRGWFFCMVYGQSGWISKSFKYYSVRPVIAIEL